MAQFFTDEADAALEKWLAPATWDADHSADERRFYHFVAALGRSGGQDSIRQDLMRAVEHYHPDIDLKSVEERISDLAHNARVVFDYLEAQRHTE